MVIVLYLIDEKKSTYEDPKVCYTKGIGSSFFCKQLKLYNMKLKELISKDYMTAFKERNAVAKNILSVVKGEIQNNEKNLLTDCLSDADVIKILNKIAKPLREIVEKTNDNESRLQLEILESYLDKQMSREEIVVKVNEIVASGITNIGLIMKEFSTLQVDRKIVSEVVKEKLK